MGHDFPRALAFQQVLLGCVLTKPVGLRIPRARNLFKG